MVWSDWWGFWACGLGDSGTPCGIRFALPRPPRFAKGTVGEGFALVCVATFRLGLGL